MTQKPGRPEPGPVEKLVRRDRLIMTGALMVLVALATLYTVFGIGMQMTALDMTRMARPIGHPMEMGGPQPWTLGKSVLIFLMWWVMMVAMMIPSAAPMLLLYAAIKRTGPEQAKSAQMTALFLTGYLATWAAFSAAATFLQWLLEDIGLSSGPMMTINSPTVAGAVLIAAGLYQFSGLKNACLSHCRSPAHFLAEHARPGLSGAFRMGVDHGFYCLGCCWAVMALLFVGGIMNLYWIVGIALYVLAEKLLPFGNRIAQTTGALMIAAGIYLIIW